MSVRTWKRIITVCVILIILSLIITASLMSAKARALAEQYDRLMTDENYINLTEYGDVDEDDIEDIKDVLKWTDEIRHDGGLEYQHKYSSLYVENDFVFDDKGNEKICYLTFDDGPDADNTVYVLDVLKEYNAKATFFVVYKDYKSERELYKRIVEEGHTIGVHTASHNYNKIYASVDAFLDDFERCSEQIESVTGLKPEIFRFPGGSVNSYNAGIYQELISEMIRRGYTYYDWNVSSGDAASSNVSKAEIVNNVLGSSQKLNRKIVLMHDGKGHSNTAEALPEIIEGLIDQGYKLEALTKDVKPVCFGYGE